MIQSKIKIKNSPVASPNELFKVLLLGNNLPMLELEDALRKILAALPPPVSERVPLPDAAQRVLLARMLAPIDLPPFDNSAMDGYALRAADVNGANAATPVTLRLGGRIPAGENFSGEVAAGECVRLFTGSPLPRGADAVVMQEDTRLEPSQPGLVSFLDAARPGENIRRRGEDIARGAVMAKTGDVMSSGRISLLTATGVGDVTVGRRPTVGLLATGSELCEAGRPLVPGQIYESNRTALAPLVIGAGGLPKIFPLVPDALAATEAALESAFAECDLVLTSGGVSVGEMDFVKMAFEKLGGELQFWKVAMRPGKPFMFGRRGGKFLFGLPGNPVSAFVTFLLLARPALRRWQGATEVSLPAHSGELAGPLANPGDRRHFMRVRVDTAGKVFSAGRQASHALASLASANGLVDVPPGKTFPAGAKVTVWRWD